jgi:RNA-directed DNA polymerase
VADRVAQTVVARRLEWKVESIFHPDSYGYRPGRAPQDAVEVCRQRCWKRDWVIDLDIQKFFDTVAWDLVVKAVEANTDLPWVVLYVGRPGNSGQAFSGLNHAARCPFRYSL